MAATRLDGAPRYDASKVKRPTGLVRPPQRLRLRIRASELSMPVISNSHLLSAPRSPVFSAPARRWHQHLRGSSGLALSASLAPHSLKQLAASHNRGPSILPKVLWVHPGVLLSANFFHSNEETGLAADPLVSGSSPIWVCIVSIFFCGVPKGASACVFALLLCAITKTCYFGLGGAYLILVTKSC